MPAVRTLLLLTLGGLALLSGCGPTDREITQAVLFALPAVTLLGGLLVALLQWLAQGRRPTRVDVIAVSRLALVMCIPAGFAAAATSEALELFLVVLWLFGASWLAVALVVWRIVYRLAPEHAVRLAVLITTLLAAVMALPEALGTRTLDVVAAFAFGGGMGYVPGGIAVLLVGERVVRAVRRRSSLGG